LLAAHVIGERAETHALLALMYLHAARLPARVADNGSLLILAEQDRSLWDRRQIQRGLAHLERSGTGSRLTRWHLEAGIAASHALAPSYAETNWRHILELYDALLGHDDSPVVALNRAIALAQIEDAAAGLRALDDTPLRRKLERYHLFHAVRGQLLLDADRRDEALLALRRAHELAVLPAERALLAQRIESCRA
jgi:RNA polymerase sigma-70 factor (ECF subfamily)